MDAKYGTAPVPRPPVQYLPNEQYNRSRRFGFWGLVVQALIIVGYGFMVDYSLGNQTPVTELSQLPVVPLLQFFLLIGFGFLLTYLRTNSWSGIGFTFMLAALVLQAYLFIRSVYPVYLVYSTSRQIPMIQISLSSIIQSSWAVVAVLIAYGAVLGKHSAFQLLVMGLIATLIFSLNEAFMIRYQARDPGGGMYVHAFGAFFGATVASITLPKTVETYLNNMGDKTSNTFAFIGTIFLWVLLPFFNALQTIDPLRAYLNTLFALCCSCVTTFAFSQFLRGRFVIDDILRSTLAGGIVISTIAEVVDRPWTAMVIGAGAGLGATLLNQYLNPKLDQNTGFQDTNSTLSLHGLPGIAALLLSVLFIGTGNADQILFGRTRSEAVGHQFILLGITLGFACVGGLITGILMRWIFCGDQPEDVYEDRCQWVNRRELKD